MANNRQYNLRSTKQNSIRIPVEIQTSSDKVFLKTLLNLKQRVNTVASESDTSSISNLDCSAVINMSDTSDIVENKISDEDKNIGTGSHQANLTGSYGSSVQMLVNQQILEQLQQIGRRLDKLEND